MPRPQAGELPLLEPLRQERKMARPVLVARRETHTLVSGARLVRGLEHFPVQEPGPASREMTVRLEPTSFDSLGGNGDIERFAFPETALSI